MKRSKTDRIHSWCFIEVDHRNPDDARIQEPDFLVCAAFVGLPDPSVLEFQLDDVLTFPYNRDTVTEGILLLNGNFRTACIDKKDYPWLAMAWTKAAKQIELSRKDKWTCPELIWMEREDDPRLRVDQVMEISNLIISSEIRKDLNLYAQTRDKNSIVPSAIAGAYRLAERYAPAIIRNKKTQEENERKPETWQGLIERQGRDKTLY